MFSFTAGKRYNCLHFQGQVWAKTMNAVNAVEGTTIERELRLQLHGAIYRLDSFVSMLSYCANLKAIRYESTSLKRIVADKSHRVIVA